MTGMPLMRTSGVVMGIEIQGICGAEAYDRYRIDDYATNISLTFGLGHPFGVQPERVPAQMNNHVTQRASSYPSCLAPIPVDPLFSDGFESGDVNAWSSNNP